MIQPQHHRWLSKLLGYDFEVVYHLGVENKVVDALSCMPIGVELLI